jgi:hypothetical protein
MLIAVATPEHLPEWLYPHRVPPLSGASLPAKYIGWNDLGPLWKALGGAKAAERGIVDTCCDVGFDHDAIEFLPQIEPEFVAALAALPDGERWQVARDWAAGRLGRRPNEQQLAQHKAWLRELSEFSRQAVANRWVVVLAVEAQGT